MAMASFSFSLMFLGVKLYSNAPTFTLVFYRSVAQAILSGLVILIRSQSSKPNSVIDVGASSSSSSLRGLLILRGTFGSLAVAAFFHAIQKLPLPDAITLQFTTPVFCALAAVPLLGETWKMPDRLGALFCLAGVLFIARPSWLFGGSAAMTETVAAVAAAATTATATAIGILGAVFAALAYVLVRRIGTRADSSTMVLYYAVISGLTAPLGAKLLGGDGTWNVIGSPSLTELKVFIGLGIFGFLGQFWTNMGLTKCDSAATATLVTNIQIAFAFFFELFVLNESISPWSVIGSALIVGYMVLTGIAKVVCESKRWE